MMFTPLASHRPLITNRRERYTGLGLLSTLPPLTASSKLPLVSAPYVSVRRQSLPKECFYAIFEGSLNFIIKEYDEEGAVDGVTEGVQAYYFGARMYDPVVGRWFCPDPREQFFDSYAYAGNGSNPIVYLDEDGESLLLAAIAGAVAGGVVVTWAVLHLSSFKGAAKELDKEIERAYKEENYDRMAELLQLRYELTELSTETASAVLEKALLKITDTPAATTEKPADLYNFWKLMQNAKELGEVPSD